MSEPVQNNQPASTTDDSAALSDAVAQADAAVPAADLDAALAEVDKMETTATDGGTGAGLQSADQSSSADSTTANGSQSTETTPSQEELDAIARQVETSVFGDGSTAADTVVSAQPVLNSTTTDLTATAIANGNPIVGSVATPQIVNPFVGTRPVAPAPALPSFLPTPPVTPSIAQSYTPAPVAASSPGAPSLAQPPAGQASLGNTGYPSGGGGTQFGGQLNGSGGQSPPNQGWSPGQPGGQGYPPFGQQPGQQFGNQGQFMPPGQSNTGYPPSSGGANQFYPGMGGAGFGGGNQNNGQNGFGYMPGQQQTAQQFGSSGQFTPPGQSNIGYPPNQGWSPGQSGGQGYSPFGQQPGQQFSNPGQFVPPGQSNTGYPPAQATMPGSPTMGSAPTNMPAMPSALVPGTVITTAASTAPAAQPAASTPTAAAVPAGTSAVAPAPATKPPVLTTTGGQVYTSLIDVLADMKLLSDEKLNQVKQEFLTTGRNYEDLLIEKKWLTEESLTKAKAKLNSLPYITIGETGISPEALSKLDESVARRYGILPFAIDKADRKLSVAMKNPLDIQAIAFVEQKTGFKLAVHYASPSEVERIIAERYAQNLSTEVNEALKDTDQTKLRHVEQDEQLANFGGVIRDAPINRIVETILEFAVKSRASDIHIEPLPNKVRVRYRIDGILVEKLVLPRSVIDAVVSRIKILGNMKIDEKRIPQDGRFNYTNDVKNVDLRVSTIPTVHGEKVNMRLLEKNLNVPTLEDLGLEGLALVNIKEAIKVPHGIILISGPTGSGKTTTLYSLINILNTPKVNIVTLEDPVEYQMIGVNQVQINAKAGLTFATGLRAFLRQDPNIIMVGEMRDRETTELAIQASLTGHLVFSTIHTSSAATALPRMTDMGAESFLIASSVTLIIAQRVVRKINPAYKEEYVPDPAVIADLQRVLGPHFDNWCMQNGKTPQTLTLFRPSANRPENEPEYLGRIAIYEVMKMNEAIGRMILQSRPASEMEQEALRNGMLLMKQDGYMKVLNGITTIEEILRVADV